LAGLLQTYGVNDLEDGLVTPDRLICPDYGASTTGHRTYQTLLGLAGLAPRRIESPFPEGSEAALATAVTTGYSGTVLICWEHHRIPAIAAGFPTNAAPPAQWPGDRFDLIWQFTLTAADPPSYQFAQLEQHALGENPQPAATAPTTPA
jgi:hypothetical protein